MINLGVTLGNSVKKLRGNISQSEFAEIFGVNLRTYQRYESGERIFPDEVLDKITKKYKLNLEDLFLKEKAKDIEAPKLKVSEVLKRFSSIPDGVYDLAHELGDPSSEVWDEIMENLEIAIAQKEVPQRRV